MYGNELLETISSFASSSPTAAIMRHAARYPILDLARPELAEITPEGAAAAEAMGRRVKGFGFLRIFHSPVKRCQQTAECVACGAAAAGLQVVHVGPEPALGVDYILDLEQAGRLSQTHGEHFVRLWMRGEIPPGVIRSTKHVTEVKVACLMRRLHESHPAGNRLDLHISHDWNIMVLREHLLGVTHEGAGWLSYLDGLGLRISEGMLQIAYRDSERRYVLPLGEFSQAVG